MRPDHLCPCGSGDVWARCHGREALPAARAEGRSEVRARTARGASVMAALRALDASRVTIDTPRPLCVIEGFLAPDLCAMLVEGFERNVARLDVGAKDPYWRERLLYYQSLAHEPEMRRVMREAREGFVRAIRDFYGVTEALYTDTVHLVVWCEGQSMRAHADNAEPDGTPNAYPWRDYASVLYLNEDFDGGEVFFERDGRRIRPRTGMLVAFSGGREHVHGVDEVRRGRRYTMPAWHTRDAARRDRDFDAP